MAAKPDAAGSGERSDQQLLAILEYLQLVMKEDQPVARAQAHASAAVLASAGSAAHVAGTKTTASPINGARRFRCRILAVFRQKKRRGAGPEQIAMPWECRNAG